MEVHHGSAQQMVSKCCLDTIITNVMLAILTITMLTKREGEVAVAKMW